MKKIKRRTEITVKTERLAVINMQSGIFLAQCDQCGKEVEMVVPDEAATIVEVSCRAIHRTIEAGELHFLEMPTLFVCSDSLRARFANPKSKRRRWGR